MTGGPPRQTLILRLDSVLARAARDFLSRGTHGYSGIEELVEVALLNQLSAEGAPLRPRDGRTAEGAVAPSQAQGGEFADLQDNVTEMGSSEARRDNVSGSALLKVAPPVPVAEAPTPSDQALFLMTNRLGPLKVAARALALIAVENGEWPTFTAFHARAGEFARSVGLRLRREGSRRWVAYPIGTDAAKAKERFIASFAMSAPGGRATGPMTLLGLGAAVNDLMETDARGSARPSTKRAQQRRPRAALTEAGWRLAALPSPVLDRVGQGTVSTEEARLLLDQVLRAPGERAAVRDFLRVVRRAGGPQVRVDELMAARESARSAELVVAERAALVGRLGELGLVTVDGRGRTARLALTPEGSNLLRRILKEEEG